MELTIISLNLISGQSLKVVLDLKVGQGRKAAPRAVPRAVPDLKVFPGHDLGKL